MSNFGFVVFETSDSVLRTLAAKPIMLYGTHRLNVEKMRREDRQERGQGDRQFQGRNQGNRGRQVGQLVQFSRIWHIGGIISSRGIYNDNVTIWVHLLMFSYHKELECMKESCLILFFTPYQRLFFLVPDK